LAIGITSTRSEINSALPLLTTELLLWRSHDTSADLRFAASQTGGFSGSTPAQALTELLSLFNVTGDANRSTASLNFGSTCVAKLMSPDLAQFRQSVNPVFTKTRQQATRTSEIQSQVDTLLPYWADLYTLRPQRHPHTMLLLEILWAYVGNTSLQIKAVFERKRPSDYTVGIQPAVAVPWHSSFQSGHSAEAWFFKTILDELTGPASIDPLTSKLKGRSAWLAGRLAENREVAGVHFACDTQAGRILGVTMAEHFIALMKGTSCAARTFDPAHFNFAGNAQSYSDALAHHTDGCVVVGDPMQPQTGQRLAISEFWHRACREWA
jgi:PAP2 superfamily